jgi:excisionase family DNA binding protein
MSEKLNGGQPAESDWLSETQVAELLTVKPRTVRGWRMSRGLPYVRISGKTTRIRRGDLEQWLAAQKVAIVRN